MNYKFRDPAGEFTNQQRQFAEGAELGRAIMGSVPLLPFWVQILN
jgi:hypothetical protein